MENSSFRDILARFLEEKSEISQERVENHRVFSPEPTPLLSWEGYNLKQTKKNAYPREARKISPTPPPAPVKPIVTEKVLTMAELSSADQTLVGVMIHLGASELKGEISLSRVKKAHRRLAKGLHPDRLEAGLTDKEKAKRQELFLTLQQTYEYLSDRLREINASACGNESASAPASQRQDAA